MAYLYTYENSIELEKPIEVVWQQIANTNRFNELSGSGTYTGDEVVQPDKSIIRYCKGYIAKHEMGNITWKWSERLPEWQAPYYYRQQRDFTFPVLVSIIFECNLVSTLKGCKLRVNLTFTGFTRLGHLMGKLRIYKNKSDFLWGIMLAMINKFEVTSPKISSSWSPPNYSTIKQKKVNKIIEIMNSSKFGHNAGARIADFAMHALATDAISMRPLQLANYWNLPQNDVIEACLQGMSLGLLDMRWDVLCPQCLVAKAESAGLHDIPQGVHCSSCNIDFGINFNENVELVFFPARWLRPIENANFCLLSSQRTPHIVVQKKIKPFQTEIFEQPFKPGFYRCRSIEDNYSIEFIISPNNNEYPIIKLTDDKLEILPEKSQLLTLKNQSSWPRYLTIEDVSYKQLALTGQKILSMHVFRQLCPEQLIKAGDLIGISNLTILFTDLKNSTAFYYEVGEAKAYRIVREHYVFLSDIIHNHNGSLVKTIGDSVMAVFYDPLDGVAACLDIRAHIAEFNLNNQTHISIKLGIHEENCIAVNMNNMMDYFGKAVNEAARLHILSNGRDIIISEQVMHNPSVKLLLKNNEIIKLSQRVKGIPNPLTFYRVIIAS